MKQYSTEMVERKYVSKEICDWCGEEVEKEGYYEINDFILEYQTGECCDGDSWGEKIEVDLCFECREKLFDKLKEIGININRIDY